MLAGKSAGSGTPHHLVARGNRAIAGLWAPDSWVWACSVSHVARHDS
jgi:hypothetical protein